MKLKKIFSGIFAMFSLTSLVACSVNSLSGTSSFSISESSSIPESSSSSETPIGKENALVVYFSLPETLDPNNMTKEEENSTIVVNGEVLGNTQYVAMLISESSGSDMFRIEAAEPYPLDHSTLVSQASAEKAANARPELANNIENIDEYDTIFLGYPNWWGDMPMIMYTFLENTDLSNKRIIPFNTNGGSGFSNTINTIANLQPNAEVVQDGYAISRDRMKSAPSGVEN